MRSSIGIVSTAVQLCMGVFVLCIIATSPAGAVSVEIGPVEISDDGGIYVTATGYFDSCTHCDAVGCHEHTNGGLWYNQRAATWECIKSGSHSATCPPGQPPYQPYDRASPSPLVVNAQASDECNPSYATATRTITWDNTPSLEIVSPQSVTTSPVNIVVLAGFKPTISANKGGISCKWATQTFIDQCPGYSCMLFRTQLMNPGVHSVECTATGGSWTVSRIVTFTVEASNGDSGNIPEEDLGGPDCSEVEP